MHVSMYYNPFVVENIEKLKKQGVVVIDPNIEDNKAKLPSENEIIEKVLDALK